MYHLPPFLSSCGGIISRDGRIIAVAHRLLYVSLSWTFVLVVRNPCGGWLVVIFSFALPPTAALALRWAVDVRWPCPRGMLRASGKRKPSGEICCWAFTPLPPWGQDWGQYVLLILGKTLLPVPLKYSSLFFIPCVDILLFSRSIRMVWSASQRTNIFLKVSQTTAHLSCRCGIV